MPPRIGYVEDDPVIRDNLAEMLTDHGFRVESYADRHSAFSAFSTSIPDLLLLDITLNDEREGGFMLCTDVRRLSQTVPIIFLTAHDGDINEISGMRLGADDYLTKSASSDKIVARINALLRRVTAYSTVSESSASPSVITFGDLQINSEELNCYWRGHRVPITLTQFWMVECLARRPGHVKSHDNLMDAANLTVEPNTIVVQIKNIRDRFRQIDPAFDAIKTERGAGYRWVSSPTR